MHRIPPLEFKERFGRAADVMADLGLDCLVLFPGPNFAYFSGLQFMRERYRITAVLLAQDGASAILGPSFEERKMRGNFLGSEVVRLTDEDDQYAKMAAWIRTHAGSRPQIGIELTTDYYHYLELGEALPKAEFKNPKLATDDLRAIKSEAEIACLRAAATATKARMDKVPAQLTLGMSELDLARLFGPGSMVQFGETTSLPNESAGRRELQARDIIVIDAGDRVAGYRSDLTRTFFFGEPTKKMREVYAVVHEAELAAIDAARPGAPAYLVDRAARQVIEKAGYGKYFLHRGGLGIGLNFHEIPICAECSSDILAPGMVLTAEPGIYLPGEFGIRLEDDMLITENGNELLAPAGPWQI